VSLGLREYARRRRAAGLAGGSLASVQKAIATGRLSASLTPDRRAVADADLADREWASTTTPTGSAAPALELPDGIPPLHESRARKEAAAAELAERKLAEHEERYVDRDEARADVIAAYTIVRTRLLGVPSRVRQRDSTLTMAQVQLLDDMIREALEELAAAEDEPSTIAY
jgi:hypothetical protein